MKSMREPMNRAFAVAVVMVSAVTLSGCDDPSIEERVANRTECEAAEGRYREWSGFWGEYKWECDLERSVEGDGK